ncbi:uncharacterized protein LOC144095071 [Amblyomma americanum]
MPPHLQCSVCSVDCTSSDGTIDCSECGHRYHTGKCAGITDATLKTKGDEYRKAWRCIFCRRSKARTPATQDAKLASDDSTDLRIWMMAISDKLDQLLPLKETIDGIEDSMQLLSDQYDDLLSRTERNEREVKELRKRVEKVETQNDDVAQLKDNIDDLEWRSRRLNLEFHGIQETDKENLLDKINALTAQIKLPALSENDVVAVHRLPAKKDKIPGIICRFARQADRDAWWQNRKKLQEADGNIFVLENLTKRTRALLFEAKNWAKVKKYKYVWHSNGRVLVRKADGLNAELVANVGDLEKLA